MKRVLALVITLSLFIMAKAQINKPDFAYPKTTAANAEKALKSAIYRGDAADALNALIIYTVAENKIDRAELQRSIRLVEETSDKFNDSELRGLFDALLAKMYYNFYRQQSWKYNSRQLPLTPLPEDLTEWSGQQFKAKIISLCKSSIGTENIAKLSKMAIDAYPDVVKCDKASVPLFPTLADFAYLNCIELMRCNDAPEDEIKGIRLQALNNSAGRPCAEIQWQSQIDCWEDKSYEALKASYEKAIDSDNSYIGLYLAFMAQNLRDLPKQKEYKALAQSYLDKYPNAEMSDFVRYYLSEMLRPSANIAFAQTCATDVPFEVKVTNTNASNLKVSAYYISDNDPSNGRRSIGTIKNKLKAAVTIDLSNDLATPFKQDTTISIKLTKPGYYAILPEIPGEEDYSNTQYMRCVPVLPFTINGAENKAQIVVVEPKTGAPIEGANIKIGASEKTIKSKGITNDKGFYEVGRLERNWKDKITIGYKGKEYLFDRLDIYTTKNSDEESITNTAQILTDRSIYHPGDTVNILAVCYTTKARANQRQQQSLLSDLDVKFVVWDANWRDVDTITTKTDEFGRAIASFKIPTDGLTGTYQIQCYDVAKEQGLTRKSIMVSDFKMPDFELTINSIESDSPEKGDVTITGNAMTYSGMPLADTKLTLNLSGTDWWHFRQEKPFYSTELTTAGDGSFTVTLNDSIFDKYISLLYNVVIDAVSPSGSTATAEQSFARTQRYNLTMTLSDNNVDGQQPLHPQVDIVAPNGEYVDLPLTWTLKEDAGITIATGDYTGAIDLSKIKPGKYTLQMQPIEKALANSVSEEITLYNIKSRVVPDKTLWVKDNNIKLNGKNDVDILLTTGEETTYLYYTLVTNGNLAVTDIMKYDYGYHNLQIQIPDSVNYAQVKLCYVQDCKFIEKTVTITRQKNTGLTIEGESFRDNLIPGTEETWNLRILDVNKKPIQAALALDMYNKALEALQPHRNLLRFENFEYYNHVYYNNLPLWSGSNQITAKLKDINKTLYKPTFNSYGLFDANNILLSINRGQNSLYGEGEIIYNTSSVWSDDGYDYADTSNLTDYEVVGYGTRKKEVMVSASVMNSAATGAIAEEAEVEEKMVVEEAEDTNREEKFDFRESEVPLAVWAPMLTTDKQGNVQYTFTVPNANTTWRLQAVAWAKDMEVGSLIRDFVASKPVMVQPNLPRFLRAGDTASIIATVMNNSDEAAVITTTVEIFNPMTGEVMSQSTYTDEIGARQSATVSAPLTADPSLSAVGYRVKASNGRFSDGEQKAIRILPSESTLVETKPFYLNPGEKLYSTRLPEEKGARLSLTFCENPVWTIVSALPGLRDQICDYANSAAAALYSAAIAQGIVKDNPEIARALKAWSGNPSETALTSMLEKNQQLKTALLNSTPWVLAAQSQTERMSRLALIFDDKQTGASVNEAITILEKLQKSDGGWAWGKWCDESSEWVTANVLAMLGDLRHLGWLPTDKRLSGMIGKAVRYYDKKVKDTDLTYCLIRPYFSDIAISDNGRKVIDATLADIRSSWKKASDPAYKAMQAQALYLNGDQAKAHELMGSLSEFGVYTPNQGLKFPSVNSLFDYAVILDAYGTVEPGSKAVDGLRQQLIVRKQGTDWGSAVVTTEIVKSILGTGTRWTVDAQGAQIKAGDTEIKPDTPIETATGSLTADLSGFAGENLSITTTGAGPAYGAVYAQFSKQMDEVKASACDDLDIEKQLFVRQGTEWAGAKELKVGDRVKVQLTIHCKRNLQYVSIIDERPATFEPVQQLPGWMWSEGVGFYRENRDAQTDLHVVYMAPGTYLLTYEMNVGIAGTFSSGVATIQSQYAPEISAHSSGSTIIVKSR